ncbi:MAG: ATP-binding protein [Lachnospirales bacterium]
MITNYIDNINSLVVYKNFKNNKIIAILKNIIENQDNYADYANLITYLTTMAEENGYSGNLFKGYITHLLLKAENTFTLMAENGCNLKDSSIYKLAKRDIDAIKEIANINLLDLPDSKYMSEQLKVIMDYTPVNFNSKAKELIDCDFNIDDIVAFHNKYGCGDVSVYRAFRYNEEKNKLVGIEHPDPITFDNLIGYEAQTKTLIDNTLAFINGYVSNNVLLVGARGTGKSSSVKALVNKYFDEGLRLVEITKEQIAILPEILKHLRPRGRKFIIFIDDLSFDEGEIQYKYMKSLLEGSSEGKPDNVVFYATSNRRHLIQEKWTDRATGSQDAEIHTADTLNEKLSLSDRFGITITYPKPTPKEYVNIVTGLAKERGIEISEEELKNQAMQWELQQKGMSGRTAKQFVNHLEWKINNK